MKKTRRKGDKSWNETLKEETMLGKQ